MKNPAAKMLSFLLVALLLFPSSVDFTHVFVGHEHEVCTHYSDSHFHEKNQECKLFDFHKNSYSNHKYPSYTLFQPKVEKVYSITTYQYLGFTEEPGFSRRGPPAG